jgi:hypothetical protein
MNPIRDLQTCMHNRQRGYATAMRRQRTILPVLLMVSALFAGAACTDAPPDTPTASDELEQGGTVKPTPAVGGGSDEDESPDPAVTDWCRDLSEATAGGQAVLEIYEQGNALTDSAIADATAVLTSSNPSDEEVDRAAADVEAACQAAGVQIGE